jgi:general secretion pathway protein C
MRRGIIPRYFDGPAAWLTRRLSIGKPHQVAGYAPEILLGLLLLTQVARMAWAVAAAPGPDYDRLARPLVGADRTLLASFDAFFRSAGGPVTVTTLDLILYGTRVDPVMGRGSAIIGGPGGAQASFAVGEEVRPGVILQAVDIDNVTLARGGAAEQLVLNQSQGGAPVTPAPSPPASASDSADAPIDPTGLVAQTGLTPRIKDDGITGYVLQPQGDGDMFNRAGLRAGDVLVSVNGMRMTSPQSVAAIVERMGQSSQAVFEVERGGKPVTLSVGVKR